MKKRLFPALLAAAAVIGSGCLRVEQTLTLKPDGSGDIEVEYAVSERAISQLKAMRELKSRLAMAAGEQNEEDAASAYAYRFLLPREEEIRRECERYAELGIKLEKLRVQTRNAWRHVELKLSFERLDALARTEAFQHVGFTLARNREGHYVFYRQSHPDPRFDPPDLSNPAVQKMVSPILGGFRVLIRLRTPTRILKTNAPQRSTRSCLWVYDFARDPEAVANVQRQTLITVFDGTGVTLPEIRDPQMRAGDS